MTMKSLWTKHRQSLTPRKLQTYLEFARTITLPDGKSKDLKYRPETHQCQLAFLEELEKGWTECTVVKPVQDGGTLVTLVPLFRRAVLQYQTVILAYPTQDSAKDIWTTKIAPILKSYGGLEPKHGGGLNGSARVVQLPTGGQFILRSSGGRGQSGQASVTGDCLEIDELEDWEDLHRVQLICKRIEEAPDPLIMNVCTVKRQQGSLILAKFMSGTMSRMHYPCPFCGVYDMLEWENVKWVVKNEYFVERDSEFFECSSCKKAIYETDRKVMLFRGKLLHAGQTINKAGEISGFPNNTKHFSIFWSRLDSPRKSLATTVESYMEGKRFLEQAGEHGHMRSFMQDYLCRPYTGDLEELENTALMTHNHLIVKASLSDWGPSLALNDSEDINGQNFGSFSRHVADPPPQAEYSVASWDVQHNRIYWVLTGFDKNGSMFDYAWGFEFGRYDRKPMNDDELYALMDRTRNLMNSLAKHTDMVIGGVDCGDNPDIIRTWVANNSYNWKAVRGASTKMKVDGNADIDGISYIRDGVILINTDNVREMVQSALRRPNDAPGSIQFANNIAQSQSGYFRHLVSKQTTLDPKTKKKIIIRGSGREDWLDCRIYSYALMTGFLQALRMQQVQGTNEYVKKIVKQALLQPTDEDGKPVPLSQEEMASPLPVTLDNKAIEAKVNEELQKAATHHPTGPVRIGAHMRNEHLARGQGQKNYGYSPNQGRRSNVGQSRQHRRGGY